MKIYDIDEGYLDFLRKTENKIMLSKSNYKSDKKFAVGIVLKIGKINYYAPLSSIKYYQLADDGLSLNKQYKQRCFPVIVRKKKKDTIVSSLRLDFMFPVPEYLLKELNFDEIEDEKYRTFIRLEYQYIVGKEEEILKKAIDLYEKAIVPTHFLHKKCCNFKLLENKYQEWIKLKEKN